jgi:hypothetical protein
MSPLPTKLTARLVGDSFQSKMAGGLTLAIYDTNRVRAHHFNGSVILMTKAPLHSFVPQYFLTPD